MWKWVWDIWRGHDFDIINTILYLSKNTWEKVFSGFPLREVGGASLFWLRESREGGVDGNALHSLHFTHSLQLWSYTERKTRVQGRVWAVSILKQVSFLQALIMEHLCTWNKVVSATAFASFGLVKSLHRGSGKTLQRFCVNWCQTCAFEIMLFISQLFYKVFYWID